MVRRNGRSVVWIRCVEEDGSCFLSSELSAQDQERRVQNYCMKLASKLQIRFSCRLILISKAIRSKPLKDNALIGMNSSGGMGRWDA